jgi:large subunit ribosomal protein L32
MSALLWAETFERNTMPNPKRRHSKQRTAKRRSHDFLTPNTGVGTCPNCSAKRIPHAICKECGTYKGRAYGPDKTAA